MEIVQSGIVVVEALEVFDVLDSGAIHAAHRWAEILAHTALVYQPSKIGNLYTRQDLIYLFTNHVNQNHLKVLLHLFINYYYLNGA